MAARLDVRTNLKGLSLVVGACLLAVAIGWAGTTERAPWAAGPAEARGVIAPYSLPRLARADDAGAVAFLQQRIAKQPGDFSDLAALAAVYVHRARATNDPAWYLLAEQAARRSLANMPSSNAAALMTLCQVAQARHDFTEATRLADVIARDHPVAVRPLRITILLATGRLQEAAKLADDGVEDDPTCSAHIQRALVREAHGDDAGAQADFKWAIAREEVGAPEVSVLARTWLGRLQAREGHLDAALDLYQEALHIAPGNGLALTLMATTELRLRQADAAASHYSQALDAGQGAPAMIGLANAEALRGNAPASKHWLETAERTLRRDLGAGGFGHRRDLARLLMARGRPVDNAEALHLMREEVRLRQDATTLAILSRALGHNGRWDEASQVIERAIATGVRDPALHAWAARVAEARGQHARALSEEAIAHQIDPAFHDDAGATVLPEAMS